MTLVYSDRTLEEFSKISSAIIGMALELKDVKDTDQMKEYSKRTVEALNKLEQLYPETIKLFSQSEKH